MANHKFNPEDTNLVSDIDGVLVNIHSAMLTWLWQRFDVAVPISVCTEFPSEPQVHDFLLQHGQDVPDYPKFVAEVTAKLWSNPGFYYGLASYMRMWQVLQRWPGTDFITARRVNFGLEKATSSWLFSHGFGPDTQVHFSCLQASKYSALYTHYLQYPRRKTVFIEDDYNQAVDIAEQDTTNRLQVLVVARPWNSACKRRHEKVRRMPEEAICKMINDGLNAYESENAQ